MKYNNITELDRMKSLINYGKVEENTQSGAIIPRVEYSQKAADGKTYGIIRECNKFYIKVAPKKDTEVLAEDFDYIGGINNRRENEYATYAKASKQFDLKMMSINEAHAVKVPVEQFKEQEESEWQINETKEMRSELNRFMQITNNVQSILSEDKQGFTMNHDKVPEAPASHPSDKKVNSPFTDTAVANGDKDFTKTATDPAKQGAPFDKDGEATNADMQSDKKPTGKTDATYTEKAQYVPDNTVADKKPSGGKVVRVTEGKRTLKLTEEQVLAWNKSKEYMDMSHGTEIGSTAPYEEAPFNEKVNEDVVDVNDVAGMEMDDEDVPFPEVADGGSYLQFEKDYNDFENNGGFDDNYDYDLSDIDAENAANAANADMDYEFVFDDDFNESKNYRQPTNEIELHVFGKHPAYQKVPMTTPPATEVAPNGARDWNDDSTKSEKPFGSQIGSSAPFDEKVIDMLADGIMKKLGFQKKA